MNGSGKLIRKAALNFSGQRKINENFTYFGEFKKWETAWQRIVEWL